MSVEKVKNTKKNIPKSTKKQTDLALALRQNLKRRKKLSNKKQENNE